jgi:hypothetical protein
MATLDTSTINMDSLSRHPRAVLRSDYHLGGRGNGCFMDPPGYPTYYTQPVYTSNGNDPRRGPTMVLMGHVVDRAEWPVGATYERQREVIDALMRRLYVPLPYEHPRVQAWERSLYAYFRTMYEDPDGLGDEHDHGKMIQYPVPSYRLRTVRADPSLSAETNANIRRDIEAENEAKREAYRAACTPERHTAAVRVRAIYPDAPAREDLIAEPPPWGKGGDGEWWTVLAERPTPEQCEPARGVSGRHPLNGQWCQWCGWTADKETENDNGV